MTRVVRARVLRGPAAAAATVIPSPIRSAALAGARRIAAAETAAEERARRILEVARARAEEIVEAAERAADELRLSAQEAARADALAQVAVTLARVADRERAAGENQIERTVALATLIAERLLGEALRLDAARVSALARTALDEATGARAVGLAAHPADAALLRDVLKSTAGRSVVITEDATLARGDLRLETEIGVLEATLGERVARLGERLRESLTR